MSKQTNLVAWAFAPTLAAAALLLAARQFRYIEDCADMPPRGIDGWAGKENPGEH